MTGEAQSRPAQDRRSGSETRRRTVLRTFRCTPDEAAAIDALAAAKGGLGALIRNTLLALPLPRKRSSTADHKAVAVLLQEMAELRAEIGKQGSNLNQLAHQANADRMPAGFAERLDSAIEANEEQCRTLLELRDACMRALGFERGGE